MKPHRPTIRVIAIRAVLFVAATTGGWSNNVPDDGPIAADEGSALNVDWNLKLHNVDTDLFDPSTGSPVARIHIENLSREFGHSGPLRVAWKPQVVLEHVTIEVADTAAWPSAAGDVLGRLSFHHRILNVVIRGLTLRIPERNGLVIEAPFAQLTEGGDLAMATATAMQSGSSPRSLADAVVPLAKPLQAVYLVDRGTPLATSPRRHS